MYCSDSNATVSNSLYSSTYEARPDPGSDHRRSPVRSVRPVAQPPARIAPAVSRSATHPLTARTLSSPSMTVLEAARVLLEAGRISHVVHYCHKRVTTGETDLLGLLCVLNGC